MSTRQLRLSDPIQISKRIGEFLGKRIHVVFTDNTSLSAELKTVTIHEMILENMRQKKVTHRMDTIAEIYIDTHS